MQVWVALEHMPALKALSLAHLPLLLQHPGMVDAMPAALWRLPRLQRLSLAGSCCHPSKLKLIAAACGGTLQSLDISTEGQGSLAGGSCGGHGGGGSAGPRLVGQPYRRLSARHLASLCEAAEHLRQLRCLSAAGSRLPLQACLALLRAGPWLEDCDLSGCCLEPAGHDDTCAGSSGQQLLLSSGARRRLDFHGAAAVMAQLSRAGGSGSFSFEPSQPPATAAAFAAALGDLTGLRRLVLAHSTGLMPRHLSTLDRLAALTSLSLAGSGHATGDPVAYTVAELPNLRRLDVSSTAISDSGLSALGSCPVLEGLAASRNRGISSAGVIAFAGSGLGAATLRSLDLSMVSVVDDAAAAALGDGCPHLRRLRLAGCSGSATYSLTPAGVGHLAGLTNLVELSLGRWGQPLG